MPSPLWLNTLRLWRRAPPVRFRQKPLHTPNSTGGKRGVRPFRRVSTGLTIARVAAMLYGVDNATLRQAGILRAQAMNYRDTRKATVTDADWQSIDEQLTQSYSLLKKAISSIQ